MKSGQRGEVYIRAAHIGASPAVVCWPVPHQLPYNPQYDTYLPLYSPHSTLYNPYTAPNDKV